MSELNSPKRKSRVIVTENKKVLKVGNAYTRKMYDLFKFEYKAIGNTSRVVTVTILLILNNSQTSIQSLTTLMQTFNNDLNT